MDLYNQIKLSMEKSSGTVNFLYEIYGLDENENYEAIFLAPSWKPEKVFKNYNAIIELVKEGPYFNGYILKIDGKKYGYIQAGSGASNMVDLCLTLGNSKCEKITFIGAVGGLKEDLKIGDIITPSKCIAGDGASLYLYETLSKSYFQTEVYPNQDVKEKA